MMSPFFAGNLYLSGHWLVILTGGLFVIPLGLYGWRIGYPIAGLLGGLVGTFCSEYYVRASIGRIDTDMLNIFFPILGAYLVLLACQAKSERWVWLWAGLAGLSMNLFVWWYERPGFTMGCFLTLLVGLIIWRHKASSKPSQLLACSPFLLVLAICSVASEMFKVFWVIICLLVLSRKPKLRRLSVLSPSQTYSIRSLRQLRCQ